MLIFGAVQVILSQIPNFHNIKWLSVVAEVMSFTYSFIGFALGLATVIGMAVKQLPLNYFSLYESYVRDVPLQFFYASIPNNFVL